MNIFYILTANNQKKQETLKVRSSTHLYFFNITHLQSIDNQMLTSARHTTAKYPNLPFKRASFTMQKDCFWRVKAYLLAYKTYPFEKRNQVPYDQKWNSFTTRHTTYSLSHCEPLARLLKCNHQEEISIINKGTYPNGQVPFTYIRMILLFYSCLRGG